MTDFIGLSALCKNQYKEGAEEWQLSKKAKALSQNCGRALK
jgi:hypothetical protein